MKKKVWIFLLTLGLVFTLAACGTKTTSPAEATATPETEEATPAPPTESGEDEEPSSGPEQASEVSMGTLTGTLDEGSEDWYTFEVADGHVLGVEFTAGEDAESMNVQLLGSEQNEIWVERRIGPTVTQSTRQVMSSSSGGTYYIKVSGGRGEYTLELATESQDDAGSGGDAGDRVADALQVEIDQTFSGEVANFDAEDWYAFEVPDGHVLNVKFTAGEDAESMNVQLLGPEQNEIWVERRMGPTVTQSTRQVMSSSSGGMYYIKVSGGHGEYSLELATESQDDAGSGGDAGDRVADALQVELGQTFSGEVANFDAEDWYAFEVADGEVLNVTFTAGEDAESMNVQLLGPEQNEIWVERRMGPTATQSVEVSETTEGTYYIRVSDGNGSYTIDIE